MNLSDLDLAIAALTRLRASLQASPALRAHVRTTPAEPTPRELEVLEHIKRGLSRASVARVLGMHLSRVNQIVASLRSKGVDVPGGVKRGAQLRVLDELRQANDAAQAEYKLACEWMEDADREAARVAAGQAKARYEKALGSVTLSPTGV
jgi:DNA-binding CsgD family transcriptional regulator